MDWDQLALYKGKTKGKVVDDRLYTNDEIKQLLDHADLRMRVVILTLLSTGMRVGGLAGIFLKDMKYLEEYKIYKFKVYNDTDSSESDKYITYCTPECASTIKKYLEWRENRGDTLKPQSPLLYRKLTPLTRDYNTNKMTTRVINLFDQPINSASLQQAMTRLQRKSNVVSIQSETDPYVKSRIRKPMMRCHSFRKIFNTICIQNNMNHSVKEKLMGHKTRLELDFNYFRPTEQHLINEYLKVVDGLTINDEYRLSKQVQELTTKNQSSEYVIKGKLQEMMEKNQEKDIQIEKMNQAMNTVFERLETVKESIMNSPKMKAVDTKFEELKISQLEQQSKIKILLEIDKKREELFATKGFVTKEDMEVIHKSININKINNN